MAPLLSGKQVFKDSSDLCLFGGVMGLQRHFLATVEALKLNVEWNAVPKCPLDMDSVGLRGVWSNQPLIPGTVSHIILHEQNVKVVY